MESELDLQGAVAELGVPDVESELDLQGAVAELAELGLGGGHPTGL